MRVEGYRNSRLGRVWAVVAWWPLIGLSVAASGQTQAHCDEEILKLATDTAKGYQDRQQDNDCWCEGEYGLPVAHRPSEALVPLSLTLSASIPERKQPGVLYVYWPHTAEPTMLRGRHQDPHRHYRLDLLRPAEVDAASPALWDEFSWNTKVLRALDYGPSDVHLRCATIPQERKSGSTAPPTGQQVLLPVAITPQRATAPTQPRPEAAEETVPLLLVMRTNLDLTDIRARLIPIDSTDDDEPVDVEVRPAVVKDQPLRVRIHVRPSGAAYELRIAYKTKRLGKVSDLDQITVVYLKAPSHEFAATFTSR